MAEKRPYEDYVEEPWRVDSARYKYAPWLIVHCKRTEVLSFTATATVTVSATITPIPSSTISFSGYSAGPVLGTWVLSGISDSFYQNVSLLLYFDHTLSQTTVIDYSIFGHTSSAFGNFHVDNAATKFGIGAGKFDGAGDYLTYPDHSSVQMEVQNFTIEGWFYTKSVAAGTPTIITKRNSNADFAPWLIRRNAAGINLFMSENGSTYGVSATGGSLVIDTWYHLAFVRNNTDIAVYIDGIRTLSASVSQSYSVRNIAAPIVLGGDTNTNYFNGSLDMVRITKGVARYTSDFTPPAYPFRNY